MNLVRLAFRNTLRHRNRTIVTIMAVFLGFTALGFMGGMVNNIFSRLKAQAIIVEKLGHITFAREGFFLNGKMDPEKYLWNKKELSEILEILKADQDVEIATPRIRMFGVVSNGKASSLFVSEAVVPEDDARLIRVPVDNRTDITGAVTLHSEKSRENEVAIGSELSALLGVGDGQYFTLMSTTKDGMANAIDADIGSVYNTGNPATNDKFVLANFHLAQRLYDTDGAERIVVVLRHPEKIDDVKNRLLRKLASAGHKVEAQRWDELSLFYNKVTAMFGVIFSVITVIITIVVLLVLLNTMLMAVSERTKEIGTMRAIGMTRSTVVRIFCAEAIIIGTVGCVLALPLLFGISFLLEFLKVSFIPPVASAPIPIKLMLLPEKLVGVFLLFMMAALMSAYFISKRIAGKNVADLLAN